MAETDIVPAGQFDIKPGKSTEVPFHMQQRNALGIPQELKDKPVLYMSSHRGAFDIRHEGHLAAFQRILRGEDSKAGNEEKESNAVEARPPFP